MKSRRADTPALVVGVDAGGSSTRAIVVDPGGGVHGYAVGAAGNPTSSGLELAAANVVATVRAAIASVDAPRSGDSGRGGPSPVRIAVAMAGASTAPPEWLARAFAAEGVPGEVALEADLAALYLSGSRSALGYAVLAGTGAIAARLVDHRIDAVSDGLGWLAGDDGSGFWVGHRVIRAVAADLDRRGPATALTAPVLALVGESPDAAIELGRMDALDRLMADVYAMLPIRLARFAPLAFEAADAGDRVAAEIVADGARLLAGTLGAVLADDHDAPVVLGGSVLAGQPRMADTVRAELSRRGLRGPLTTVPDGVVGAALLALEGAGHPVDDDIAERVRSGR